LLTSHFLLSPNSFCAVYYIIHILSVYSGPQKCKAQLVPFHSKKTYWEQSYGSTHSCTRYLREV
jgi:hypothetical protein